MSGEAMTRVENQLSTLNGWAESALSAASSALGNLGAIELGDNSGYSVTITGTYTAPVVPVVPTTPAAVVKPIIPTILSPVKPTKPAIVVPLKPTYDTIAIPNAPEIVIPPSDVTKPAYNADVITHPDFHVDSIIISDDPWIQAAITKLLSNIQTGGSGLSAAVEAAIWDREREREEQQLDDSIDKATAMWSQKGWSLPDGELADSLMVLQAEYLNRNLSRSREIAIEQGRLEQTNIFKSLELIVNLAHTLITMLIQYQELILRGMEDSAKFANEYIELKVKQYSANVETYKAYAQIYAEQVKAQLAKAEVFKAQVEGQLAKATVNDSKAKAMLAEAQANIAIATAYEAEVKGVLADAEIEKVKIEAALAAAEMWCKETQVDIEKFRAEIEKYRAEGLINISAAEVHNKFAEAEMNTMANAAAVSMKSHESAVMANIEKAKVLMEAARGVAQGASAMAAGAMAAASAHASMTYSESMSLDEAV